MTTVEDIEKTVEKLPADQLARFRAWFEDFDAARFDARIERDAKAGKLDQLAREAKADFRAGRARELGDILRARDSGKRMKLYPKPCGRSRTITMRSSSRPTTPLLQLKKVGEYWSVRVGLGYRALAVEIDEGLLWFWIGRTPAMTRCPDSRTKCPCVLGCVNPAQLVPPFTQS